MKIKSFIALLLLITTFVYLVSCKNDSALIVQNMEINPDNKDTVLINTSTSNTEGYDATRSYSMLDVKTKITKPIPSQWKGCFDFYANKYDALNFDDLIGNYKPEGKAFYEIGRFDEKTKQYRTLISDSLVACGLVYDSKKHNSVFYQKGINEQSCQEICIMDRDGKNNRIITNGFKIQVFNCRPVGENMYLIDGLTDYTRNHCFLIYNIQTQKLIVMSDKNLSYDFIDLYDDKILTRVTNNNESKIRICLVDYNGVIQRTIITINDTNYDREGMYLFDKDNQRLFYSYVTEEDSYKIIEIELKNGSEKMLFTKKIMFKDVKEQDKYHPPLEIRYNKQKNDLVFIMERRKNPSDPTKLHFLKLTSGKIETFLLPDNATYCYSSDEQYILCIGINGNSVNNKIVDLKNNKLINLQEKKDIGLDIDYIFSEITNQFIISTKYLIYPEDYWIHFISTDGSVESIKLPIQINN